MLKIISLTQKTAAEDLRERMHGTYATILADPPWQFQNRTGKMAPEHHRLLRYSTMTLEEIMELPVPSLAAASSHLYLWIPNALITEGLQVMKHWGFTYKPIWFGTRCAKTAGRMARGRFLFPKCHRVDLVWRAGKYADISSRPTPS